MDALRFLTKRLGRNRSLSAEELDALASISIKERSVAADEVLIREGDRPTSCMLLLAGFAARCRVTADGKRQIFSLHIAGDFVDLQSFTLPRMDHSIVSISKARLAVISHEVIEALCKQPGLNRILWQEAQVESAILREHIVSLGRRDALQRVAHILCELIIRLEATGLAIEGACELPLTQSELAEAAGLSTVHVNRVLQELRRKNLIRYRSRQLTVLNWTSLKLAAQFDPSYLQI